MKLPDVLGNVLSEAINTLDNYTVEYTIQSIPMSIGDENKTKRIIRQRIINDNTTELLIAYF